MIRHDLRGLGQLVSPYQKPSVSGKASASSVGPFPNLISDALTELGAIQARFPAVSSSRRPFTAAAVSQSQVSPRSDCSSSSGVSSSSSVQSSSREVPSVQSVSRNGAGRFDDSSSGSISKSAKVQVKEVKLQQVRELLSKGSLYAEALPERAADDGQPYPKCIYDAFEELKIRLAKTSVNFMQCKFCRSVVTPERNIGDPDSLFGHILVCNRNPRKPDLLELMDNIEPPEEAVPEIELPVVQPDLVPEKFAVPLPPALEERRSRRPTTGCKNLHPDSPIWKELASCNLETVCGGSPSTKNGWSCVHRSHSRIIFCRPRITKHNTGLHYGLTVDSIEITKTGEPILTVGKCILPKSAYTAWLSEGRILSMESVRALFSLNFKQYDEFCF